MTNADGSLKEGGVTAPPFFHCEMYSMTDSRRTNLPIGRGLRGRCPRCGEGRLFQGFLSLRTACDNCGLTTILPMPAMAPRYS